MKSAPHGQTSALAGSDICTLILCILSADTVSSLTALLSIFRIVLWGRSRCVFNQLIKHCCAKPYQTQIIIQSRVFLQVINHVWGSLISKRTSFYLSWGTYLLFRIFSQQLTAFIALWKHKQTHKQNVFSCRWLNHRSGIYSLMVKI